VKEFNATTGAFVQTFVTSGSGGLSGPKGLDFGPDGNLYVASANDNAVRKFNGANGAFMSVFVPSGSGGLSGPVDLAFKPSAAASNVPTLSDGGAALLFGAILLAGAKRLRGLPRVLHSRRRSG
jgi:DNA-binding beta-propeller fold protein YncE